MHFEIFQDALAFHFDDGALMVHEIVNGKIFLERIINSIKPALFQPGKIKRGLPQRLAGDRAGVDAASAHVLCPFNDRDAFAEIGGLRARFFAGGAAANHNQIKVFTGSHTNLLTPLDAVSREKPAELILSSQRKCRRTAPSVRQVPAGTVPNRVWLPAAKKKSIVHQLWDGRRL